MKRRHFITGTAAVGTAALAGGGLYWYGNNRSFNDPRPTSASDLTDSSQKIPWRNWSEYLLSYPDERISPRNEDELIQLFKSSKGTIRPVGAGHSFSPLVPTNDTLLSMRRFNGLKHFDAATKTATVFAGTRLGQMGKILTPLGQSLPNMPDIDEQSLAGGMATATHGTGQKLGALHTYVTGLRLVTPMGEVIDCSPENNADVFYAAQVSLGSLGVITEYTLQNVASENLKRRTWMAPLDELIEQFDELTAANHSFEMYFIPHLDKGVAVSINPTDEPVSPRTEDPDNNAVLDLQTARNYLDWWPWLRSTVINGLAGDYDPQESVDVWYKAFPSERNVRFNEMEYHMPREHLLPMVRKVKEAIETHHPEVFYPCEVRTVNGLQDNAWLSPFYQHESGSIAVHRYFKEDPKPLFSTIEPLYKAVNGVPHWGKMHTKTAETLAPHYSNWQAFLNVRRQLDPQGKMLNDHLKQVFGVS